VYCGPGHIRSIYSTAYSGHNIQLNVYALLPEIWREFNAGCTTNIAPNTAHIRQFTLCERWPRLYTKYLQLRIVRLQYSTIGICAAIGDIPTMGRALYRKHWAKYCAHPPVFAMKELWSRTYTMHLQLRILSASIFNWTYVRCSCRYHDNSMHVTLQTWCQIQRTPSSFRYVNSDPGHIQCIYISAYSVLQYSTERICAAIGHITTIQCALYCKLGAKYSAHPPVYAMCTVVPTYTMYLQFRIFSASIFNWTYLRCNWRYHDNSMSVILQIWCQI
jgi:hypothetical protein